MSELENKKNSAPNAPAVPAQPETVAPGKQQEAETPKAEGPQQQAKA
jgi:hypothetical protein